MKLAKSLKITIAITAVATTAFGTYAGVQAFNGGGIISQTDSPVIIKTFVPPPEPTPSPTVEAADQGEVPAESVEPQVEAPRVTPVDQVIQPEATAPAVQAYIAGQPVPTDTDTKPATDPSIRADAYMSTFNY